MNKREASAEKHFKFRLQEMLTESEEPENFSKLEFEKKQKKQMHKQVFVNNFVFFTQSNCSTCHDKAAVHIF